MNSVARTALSSAGPARGGAASGVVTLFFLAALAMTIQQAAALPARFTPTVVGGFALVLAILLPLLARYHPHPRFGAANGVTMARAALVSLLLGTVCAASSLILSWGIVLVATVAASLDALDGSLARRQGTTSVFGARFDVEVDAGLILILALLVWQFEKAGAWVLASGLARYAFVLAGLWLPWLRAQLPASLRRQSVCVLQIVMLIACMAPVVPVPWSAGLAALGLVALGASFYIDIAWLARERRRAV